jgi:hypothetical protein
MDSIGFKEGVNSLIDMSQQPPNLENLRKISEKAKQKKKDAPEECFREELQMGPGVYIGNLFFNLCYYYQQYFKQLFLITDPLYEIFKTAFPHLENELLLRIYELE